ncbi:hypothetical protein SAMN05421776_12237 [Nocardia farcinica]|uniref:Uncharacterized protein n=2 Tax=Nocardia farcinica TaxID=37329 RepID=A0A0H5NR53_NOCFR|nr:Uncharacterised protein [Nocardia farcinica]SIT34224.1 hypothetical protein SAMN05421776_12237 [Nocardia farcinica]SUE30035.1 Uncharacterised protein [Nocardia farcinica]
MQDADENVQKLVHSLLAPQPMQYLTEPVPAAPGVPASYAITTEDVSLPPDEWGFMPCLPQRLGDVPIIETPGSHEAKISPAPSNSRKHCSSRSREYPSFGPHLSGDAAELEGPAGAPVPIDRSVIWAIAGAIPSGGAVRHFWGLSWPGSAARRARAVPAGPGSCTAGSWVVTVVITDSRNTTRSAGLAGSGKDSQVRTAPLAVDILGREALLHAQVACGRDARDSVHGDFMTDPEDNAGPGAFAEHQPGRGRVDQRELDHDVPAVAQFLDRTLRIGTDLLLGGQEPAEAVLDLCVQ